MAIVGAIIGAGFISGKEIVSFFGGTGYYALLLLLPLAFLFFVVLFVFAKLGKEIKPQSISDLTFAMFGKAGVVVDFGFIIATFITLASMLAGSDSIGLIMFGANYNFCYIGIFTAMIVTIIVFYGLKYIYKITDFILPIMLILVLFFVFVFIVKQPRQSVTVELYSKNGFMAIVYLFLYVFMNTFSNTFIVAKSSQYMNKRQTGIACVITSVMLCAFVGLILIAILHGGDDIFASDMPMLAVANALGGVFGVIYSIVLWLAIFTTICIAAYTIVQWLNNYIKNKFLCSVITVGLGFVFSRFGFSTIVDIFYPLEGIFGGVFIVYAIVFYFKNKNMFFAQQKMELSQRLTAESLSFEIEKEPKKITKKSNQLKSIEITKQGPNIKIKKKYQQKRKW